ncbi:PREDICTED: protein TIC 21, chloroplastic [Tarenaya hassleriana]|uniref:protein TIC 21, chloroplastic n=1 Tax=Tarenaya hassleriana TaxID=28532 RepID=UPI00053C67D6|nr:PREDICTED: protein TIC 21, chloroplastic [Tarenaya hassleriana]
MRSLLSPAASSGVSAAAMRPVSSHVLRCKCPFSRLPFSYNPLASAPNPLKCSSAAFSFSSRSPPSPPFYGFQIRGLKPNFVAASSSPVSPASPAAADTEVDKAKLAQVTKRLEKTSRYFKRLGSFGFWGQIVCTVVAAVILSFSVVVTGKPTSPATFYATAGGIAAAFVSVFWSFGYIRLSERLRKTATDPSKAPPRAEVVRGLKSGIVVNLMGMGAAILGMQATVGFLVAKALTTSATPFYQGVSPGYSPVLALDVFLVQASANTILSHFLGLVCSLELLRSVTLPASEPAAAIPKIA